MNDVQAIQAYLARKLREAKGNYPQAYGRLLGAIQLIVEDPDCAIALGKNCRACKESATAADGLCDECRDAAGAFVE